MTKLRILLVIGFTALLTLGGCGGSDSPAQSDNGYVGKIAGTDAYIAIVVADNTVVAYACDGPNLIAESFWSKVDDATAFRLETPSGAVLQGEILGRTASGVITLRDGTAHKFIAKASTGEAGVYYTLQDSRLDPEYWGGWVMGNDGTQRGALKLRGQFQATPELASTGVAISGTNFAVARIGSSGGRFIATRIAVPSTFSATPDIVLKPPSPVPPISTPYPN